MPITAKVFCFCRLLKCLRSNYDKQCALRLGALWSGFTLFPSLLKLVSNVRQVRVFAPDDFSRRHFQMHFCFKGWYLSCSTQFIKHFWNRSSRWYKMQAILHAACTTILTKLARYRKWRDLFSKAKFKLIYCFQLTHLCFNSLEPSSTLSFMFTIILQ